MTLFTRKNTYLCTNVHLLHVDDLEIKKCTHPLLVITVTITSVIML
jgi:hypothetical protein